MPIERFEEGALLGGRYRIVEIVGRGGMGTVYRARDLRLDTDVAVKEMREAPGDAAAHEAAVAQFEREAKLLAQLSHPNLPRVTDYFVDADRWVLVMEFVAGTTAEQLLSQSEGAPLPARDVLRWGEQIAAVLHYLHSQSPPIVFRDVKPANIIVQPDGAAKLVDFGIARRFRDAGGKDTIAYGSPGYSPPEQYGRGQTDPRADVFALGATLYHLLTGDDPAGHPFKFAPLRRFDPSLPPALEAMIAACVESDEKRRCSSAEALRCVLKDAHQAVDKPSRQIVSPSVPPPAPSIVDTRAGRVRQLGPRRRFALIGAAVVLLVVIAAVAVAVRARRHTGPSTTPVTVATYGEVEPPPAAPAVQVGQGAGPAARSGTTLHIKTTPDGAKVLLDGRQVGITPCDVLDVAAGLHQVCAVAPSADLMSVQWPIEAAGGAVISLAAPFATRDPNADPNTPGVELISDSAVESATPAHLRPGVTPPIVLVTVAMRATCLDSKTAVVVARFYDKATGNPLRPSAAGTALADAQGYLAAVTQIPVSANAALFPAIELAIPRDAFPLGPAHATYEVTVYIGDATAATAQRSPISP